MLFNLLIIGLVIGGAIAWGSKGRGYGLFSSFLAAVCTIIAGGVAFALWEPVTYSLILPRANAGSAGGRLLEDTAWALGLLVPFAVCLLVLRLAVDSLVKWNLKFSEVMNFIGGVVFGLVTMTVTVGIIVIAVGFMRLPPSMLGFQAIEEENGNPVYARSLLIPVDKLTSMLYERLSVGAFGTDSPLAANHPRLYEQAAMVRMNYKGASRVTVQPEAFEVAGWYTIDAQQPLASLLVDSFLAREQKVVYPDGSTPEPGSRLVGTVIRFKSGAKEKGGSVVLTPSQLRLIASNPGDPTVSQAIHPIAVVAPPEAGSLGLYRFRFDAPESVISSVGGGSDAIFAFEFVVPAGMTPTDLLVKNVRAPKGVPSDLLSLPAPGPSVFRTVQARDEAIRDTSLFSRFGVSVAGATITDLDTSGREVVAPSTSGVYDNIMSSNRLPGFSINRSNAGALSLTAENHIRGGEAQFTSGQLGGMGLDPNLRVDAFETTRDTGIIQVVLSERGARSLYGRSMEAAEQVLPPLLLDSNGTSYEAIGFIYQDADITRVRFTPDRPLRALSEAPQLSRTKRDQTLRLLFRPTKGVSIVSLTLGSKEIARFDGPGVMVR